MSTANKTPPDALLLVTDSCPHCPTVLAGLAELVKQGEIGRLEVVNLGVHPQLARMLDVRTVPWLRLGPFELDGLRTPAELKLWARRAGTSQGMAEYFRELLADGALARVTALVRRAPAAHLAALLLLLDDPDTELPVRVGIGAVIEEFEGREPLAGLIEPLGRLTRSPQAHVRGDACHYLGLSHSAAALPYVRALLTDPERQVREIAAESLERLAASGA